MKNTVVENPNIVYNDGVTKVYLYTKGTKGGNDNLRALLNFMENSNEEIIAKLMEKFSFTEDEAIEKVTNN